MAKKRYSDEDVLNLLRQIELSLASGSSIETACRSAGISDATYYNWHKSGTAGWASRSFRSSRALRRRRPGSRVLLRILNWTS